MPEPDEKQVLNFLKELMEMQRRYANELKGGRSNRQSDVKELVEKFAAKGDDNAD